jgi:hypothetical protein
MHNQAHSVKQSVHVKPVKRLYFDLLLANLANKYLPGWQVWLVLGMSKKNKLDGFYIVRTDSAGVFAGNIVSRKKREVRMKNAIRLHYWDGAASLSQLATEGVTKPEECRFCVPVKVTLFETIEILNTTEAAEKNIKKVPSWKM